MSNVLNGNVSDTGLIKGSISGTGTLKGGVSAILGKDGKDGEDGISATHSWDGTTLTVTSASGTSSADLKGDKGDKGDPGRGVERASVDSNGFLTVIYTDGMAYNSAQSLKGKNGLNGTSVTVAAVAESTVDGGTNIVSFSDGKQLRVKNGNKGDKGDKGDTGNPGMYIGSGDMPDGYNVQIDPNGEAIDGSDLAKASDVSQLAGDVAYLLTKKVEASDTGFFTHIKSENLADPNKYEYGYFTSTGGKAASKLCLRQYIFVSASGSYTFPADVTTFGSNMAKAVPTFRADKTFYKTIWSSTPIPSGTSEIPITIKITDADIAAGLAYIGVTIKAKSQATAMVVNSDVYPDEFIPYQDIWTIDCLTVLPENAAFLRVNELHGKTAVFDGDSICNGSSAQDDKSGWAGRIGSSNSMRWKNYGVNGGTIAAGTQLSGANLHWISRNIDTIHTEFPTIDYLIIEGGTNDADLLSADKLGTINETDYSGTYDDTTFIGALETLFYKAAKYYPSAKIGYIVAQKMGLSPNAHYAKRYSFFETAMQVCKKWGIPCLNLWDGSHLNPHIKAHYDSSKTATENRESGSLYTDGQHLTAEGYEVVTARIESWMRTL